jgi:1-acyl-sn-glycerol-3-phosphate acyltransferase
MIYRVMWALLRGLYRVFFRGRFFNAERVPAEGAVILASNHVSLLDPPVVAIGVWRPCTFMAKEELFRNPLFGWFIRKLGAFPVKRGSGDRGALRAAFEALEAGKALVMFPEGTRSETGELKEPELGVGMIAVRSGAPVVPVYVRGTRDVLPKSGGLHLSRIETVYGEPLRFAAREGVKPAREDYEAAAHTIMAEIARLRDSLPALRASDVPA